MLVFVIVPARQGSVKATDGLRQADNRKLGPSLPLRISDWENCSQFPVELDSGTLGHFGANYMQ